MINKLQFSKDWEKARIRVLKGIEKLGRDIPITGYSPQDAMKEETKMRKMLNAKHRW